MDSRSLSRYKYGRTQVQTTLNDSCEVAVVGAERRVARSASICRRLEWMPCWSSATAWRRTRPATRPAGSIRCRARASPARWARWPSSPTGCTLRCGSRSWRRRGSTSPRASSRWWRPPSTSRRCPASTRRRDCSEREEGFSGALLDESELYRMAPGLATGAVGGVHTRGNAALDSYLYTVALARRAEQLGARVRTGAARGLRTDGDRVEAVLLEDGEFSCGEVVLAMGPWSASAESWLAAAVPVTPLRGEIVRTDAPGVSFEHDLSGRGRLSAPEGRPGVDRDDGGAARLRRGAGRCGAEVAHGVCGEARPGDGGGPSGEAYCVPEAGEPRLAPDRGPGPGLEKCVAGDRARGRRGC